MSFISNEYTTSFGFYQIKHLSILLYFTWFGNFWEHLIRTMKCCLYESLGLSSVNYFYLVTILSDIQNVICNRPLTCRCSSESGLDIIYPNKIMRPCINERILIRKLNIDISSTEVPDCQKRT